MQLYQRKCEGPMRAGIRQGVISGFGFGVSFFLLFCVYATSFYAGARLVEEGKTTFPKVFRVFLALAMAAIGVSQSSSLTMDSSKAKGAAASIFAIIDRKSKIDPSEDNGLTLENVRGSIEFRHVNFRYPTRPDIQIFRDLCLSIHSGQVCIFFIALMFHFLIPYPVTSYSLAKMLLTCGLICETRDCCFDWYIYVGKDLRYGIICTVYQGLN